MGERDRFYDQGDANADLPETLLLAGKPDEAAAAFEQALDRYERKENLVSARLTRAQLVTLAASTGSNEHSSP